MSSAMNVGLVSQNTSTDADLDSLFGSPPPPSGRSPSPLALPSATGSAQNVGTLALPGSHLVAEASVCPPASLPLSDRATNVVPRSRPHTAVRSYSIPQPSPHTTSTSTCRAAGGLRKSRKGKEKATNHSRAPTPRPAQPEIELPSPDQPCPPNFLRNQQALLGLAGLIGGVNHKQLSVQRGSAQNPIVVDDVDKPLTGGPLTSQPRSISRHHAPGPAGPSQLPPPSGEEILASLVRSGNILPVVQSLIRLLSGPAPAAPPPPKLPTRSGWERTERISAPPLKRRKLNKVPAGATDWDIPYPFQDGQGPQDYQETWARERVRALLADLAGLVQGAAKKAAVKGYYQQQERERQRKWVESKTHEGIAKGYYRARTATYGLEPGKTAGRPVEQGQGQGAAGGMTPGATGSGLQTSGLSNAPNSTRQTMSEPPPQSAQPPQFDQSMTFDDLVASLLAASGDQQLSPLGPSPLQRSSVPAYSSPDSPLPTPSPLEADSAQPYVDDWLALLNAFPPGDPDDASHSAAFDGTFNSLASAPGSALPDFANANVSGPSATSPNSAVTGASAPIVGAAQFADATSTSNYIPVPSVLMPDGSASAGTIPDFLIDPTLLELPAFPTAQPQATTTASSSAPAAAANRSQNLVSTMSSQSNDTSPSGNTLPATLLTISTDVPASTLAEAGFTAMPSGVDPSSSMGSPFASTVSLADQEQGPATPDWSWAFGEPGIAGTGAGDGPSGEGLDEMMREAGIDVEELRELEREFGKACGEAQTQMQVPMDVDAGSGVLMPVDACAQVHAEVETLADVLADAQVSQQDVFPGSVDRTQGPSQVGAQTLPSSSLIASSRGLEYFAAIGSDAATANDALSPAQFQAQNIQPNAAPQQDAAAMQGAGPVQVPAGPYVQPASPVQAHYHLQSLDVHGQLSAGSTPPSTSTQANWTGPASATTPAPASTPYSLATLLSLAAPSLLSPQGASSSAAQKALTKQSRARILEQARALREELEKARQRTRVELWEVSVEMSGLVALGKELERGEEEGRRRG